MEKTPVIVVGYKRASVISQTLTNLSLCDGASQHRIIVYLDGAREASDREKIEETYHEVMQFKEKFPLFDVVRRKVNLGCRENIYQAVWEVLKEYGKMILVEDDVLVSRTFLVYMESALNFYKDDKRIWGINAYQCRHLHIPKSYPYDVYLNPRNWTPGWGTWRDRWESVDFDLLDWNEYKADSLHLEKIDIAGLGLVRMIDSQANHPSHLNAWDVQCTYHMIKNDLYSIEPRFSLTKNVGFGMESEHCKGYDPTMPTQKYYNFLPKLEKDLPIENSIMKQFRYCSTDPRFWHRVVRKLKRIIWKYGPTHDRPIDVVKDC